MATSTASKRSSKKEKKEIKQLCQECQKAHFQYTCPRCAFRSCSLKCCVSHKQRTNCNGKRDRTGTFLPVARMDDSTLQSDYHFLEDVVGMMDRAKRSVSSVPGNHSNNHTNKRPKMGGAADAASATPPHSMLQQLELNSTEEPSTPSSTTTATGASTTDLISHVTTNNPFHTPQPQLGPKWRHFWHQAKLRGIHLLLMPQGMQRRKDNSSYVHKSKHKTDENAGVMYWNVDVRIHPSIATTSVDTTSTSTSTSCNDKKPPTPIPTIQSIKLPEHAILWKELQQRLDSFLATSSMTSNNHTHLPLPNKEKIHWLLEKRTPVSQSTSTASASHHNGRPLCYIEITPPPPASPPPPKEETPPDLLLPVQENPPPLQFHATTTSDSLQSILKGMVVIEYPTIELVPASRLQEFPLAITEVE